MSFASIAQSGIIKQVQPQANKTLISLEVEQDKAPLLVEVYGKLQEIAKELKLECNMLFSGKLLAENNHFIINADSITPALGKTSLISICGRCGSDPEIRFFDSGKQLTTNRLAVNTFGRENASWFSISAWGKQADVMGNHTSKGAMLGVIGRLNIDSWTAKDGSKKSKHVVTVNSVHLMPKSMSNQSSASSSEALGYPAF
ncbi:MAG: single-stranded DNA-binding protein [Xenococcus sp. (in: cyanobacteria)]